MKVFKGKKGSKLIIEMGVRVVTIPHCVQACGLLVIFLSKLILFTQFVLNITEGEAREQVWSSVSYLFLISTSSI